MPKCERDGFKKNNILELSSLIYWRYLNVRHPRFAASVLHSSLVSFPFIEHQSYNCRNQYLKLFISDQAYGCRLFTILLVNWEDIVGIMNIIIMWRLKIVETLSGWFQSQINSRGRSTNICEIYVLWFWCDSISSV